MTIRPGKAKGPFVGDSMGAGSFAPVDAEYVVVSLNGTLTAERRLQVSGGLTLTDGGANNDITIDGSGVIGETGTLIPSFHDDFQTSKPFWPRTEAITSGDWQVNTGNQRLDGIAENNTKDWIRQGIEGDVDVYGKFDRNSASSCGLYLDGNSVSARISRNNSGLFIVTTGESNLTPSVGSDVMWLRIKWDAAEGTLSYYWKVNDSDAWTLQQTYTGKHFGHDKEISLDSSNGGELREIYIFDNKSQLQTRSIAANVNFLTDAATIAIDLSLGNVYSVTLGGNRDLGAPTNPLPWQKWMLKVIQDGTGSRTLGYNAIFNFSSGLPEPTITSTADYWDWLGFIYDPIDNTHNLIALVQGFS